MKNVVDKLLAQADIKVNGNRPWDIQVHNHKFYEKVLSGGSLSLGETYMDGWWDVKNLDEFFYRLLNAELDKKVVPKKIFLHILKAKIINMQTKVRSKKVAQQHYDIGNNFYEHLLDKRMQYTCAYWPDAKTLDEAQEKKLDLVCKKLMLKKGDKVLELGCGWGGFAKYAAEKYGCEVTAYNISKEQVAYARANTKGLPVKIIQSDYRDAKGVYDKVVSVGLCEHVGYKNYKKLMKIAHDSLKDNGLFLLHTIGVNKSETSTDPWIDKYIFPNSMIPSVSQLGKAFEGKLVLEDWHNFGPDYDKTLMEWNNNFEKNWPKFKEEYGERFYRMWRYYLLSCAAAFRLRHVQLWQIVLSKKGIPNGYKSIR